MDVKMKSVRVFRMMFLLVCSVCALPVVYVGFRFVRDVIGMSRDGIIFDTIAGFVPGGTSCAVIRCGVRVELILAAVFLSTAAGTFLAWAYARVAGMPRTLDYMPRMRFDVAAGMIFGCCAATAVAVTGAFGAACAGFLTTALADSNAGGFVAAMIAALAAQWIVACVSVPCYFLWRKMAGFITWTWITGR